MKNKKCQNFGMGEYRGWIFIITQGLLTKFGYYYLDLIL